MSWFRLRKRVHSIRCLNGERELRVWQVDGRVAPEDQDAVISTAQAVLAQCGQCLEACPVYAVAFQRVLPSITNGILKNRVDTN